MAEFVQPIAEMIGQPERPASQPGDDPRATALYREEETALTAREALALMVRSWPFISQHGGLLIAKFALAFFSLFFFLLTPWPIKIIIDNVIDGHPLTGLPRRILFPLVGDDRLLMLWVVTGFLAIVALLIGMVGDRSTGLGMHVDSGGLDQAGFTDNEANAGWSLWNGVFGLCEAWVTLALTQRINQTLRTVVYERFLRSPLRLYAEQKIGDAVFRVMHDSAAIGTVLYSGLLAPLLSAAMCVMVLIVLSVHFSNEPLIPILAALALPIIAIAATLFGRPLREQGQRMRERGSEVMAAFEERIAQVQLIKAFGQEERETASIDTVSWGSFHATLRIIGLVAVLIVVLVPLVGLLFITGLDHLMLQVIEKRLTLGDVVLLISYGLMLGEPVGRIASTWAVVQPAVAGLRRIHSVLDRLAEGNAAAPLASIDSPIRSIELRDVAVGYDPSEPVLSHVSMDLHPGGLIALAGASGCGKSTLISLIPRFLEPLAGAILINGRDARDIDPASARVRIGFVFQQESLFSATIDYNIRYGTTSAGHEAVRRAAALAGADFIEGLPAGYQTLLGRRGARVSVGQKHRIAIARALLRDPDVLILDEPTAPLDSASAAVLMATLKRLARDRIVLLVAHRPQTLAQAERVFFIAQRTLIASGPHHQLLGGCAAYRDYLTMSESEIQS